jgi:signal transduction histidine kinase
MASSLASEIRQLQDLTSGHEMVEAEGFHRYLEALAGAAARMSDATRTAAVVFHPSKREVSFLVCGGGGWSLGPGSVPFQELHDGLTGWVLRTGEVAVSSKECDDPRESPEVRERRRQVGAGAVLVAPLVGHGVAQGTLTAVRTPDQPDFTADEGEALGLLARFAGRDMEYLAQRWDKGAGPLQNLLSNLSHELRTPLNGILGFSQLLEAGPLTADQEPMVSHIVRSGQRLLETVDNLLDLAQFDTGRVQWEDSPFAPQSVFESVTGKYRALAEGKGLKYVVKLDPSVPVICQGDPVRMGQAWGHVLSNAIKFTATGSVTSSLTLEPRTDGPNILRFVVEDTGVGFSPGDRSKTFVPFRQEDSSWTRKFGGTGVGLALCDRIARALGGGLIVESRVGEGATVTVLVAAHVPR